MAVPPAAFACSAFADEAGVFLGFLAPDTYTLFAVDFNLEDEAELFTFEPSGGTFVYTGDAPRTFRILGRASISLPPDGGVPSDLLASLAISVGSSAVPANSPNIVQLGTSSFVYHLTTEFIVTLTPGDPAGRVGLIVALNQAMPLSVHGAQLSIARP